MYVSLNNKTEYSFLNSIIKTDELIQTAKDWNMPALAITDLNNLFNAYHFQEKCKKQGIKPILGCTFTLTYHAHFGNLILLAMNQTGWKNLIQLSTIANSGPDHTETKSAFAWITLTDLKSHSDGLIALTGGHTGLLYRLYTKGEDWLEYLKELVGIFGSENLWVELSRHHFSNELRFAKDLETPLKTLNLRPVAGAECYYLKPEHAYHRSLALSMNPNPNGLEAYSAEVSMSEDWYFKSPETMEADCRSLLDLYPDLLENTLIVANRCNAYVPDDKKFPEFPVPHGYSNAEYLRYLAMEGFEEKFGNLDSEKREVYLQRLEREISVIETMGFVDYHLITADFIQWAKDEKVYEHPRRYFPESKFPDLAVIPEKIRNKDYEILVGPGRGSAAGSLLCSCLKITDLDPIEDNLLFERFLNIERVSMPDIDTDFANYGRYDVIEYCQAKYGYDKVCQIATFQTLGVRGIIKSVGKALGIAYSDTNEMTGMVPKKLIVDEEEVPVELLSQIEELTYFKDLIQKDSRVKDLFAIGKVLEGLPSASGKHAAGVIISGTDLQQTIPLMEVDGVMVSQFEKRAVESINLLKMDFLGLQTLDVLHETQQLIEETTGEKIRLEDIDRQDAYTFEKVFQTGHTNKVFQFESDGMKDLLVKMKPVCLMDLCLANAAYRPGPMQFIDEFLQGRSNPAAVHYPCKEYETIARETNGILFYQEQVMQVVQAMAGFTLGQADILRRGIGKKVKKYIDDGRVQFIEGCQKMGTADETLAREIYSTIEKFANYGFNKSHSDAYGYVAYLCGWFKAHYPIQFMAANCTVNADNPDKLAVCLAEVKRLNIPLLPPDVRYSSHRFILEETAEGTGIRFSLGAIRTIRAETAKTISEAQNKDSLFDLMMSVDGSIKKNQMENLICSGALDYLGSRKGMLESLPFLREAVKTCFEGHDEFGDCLLSSLNYPNQFSSTEFPLDERILRERKVLQISLSGHPVSGWRTILKRPKTIQDTLDEMNLDLMDCQVEILAVFEEISELTTKRGDLMAVGFIGDEFTRMKATIFPTAYATMTNLNTNQPCILSGNFQMYHDELSFVVQTAHPVTITPLLYVDYEFWNNHPEISQHIQEHNGVLQVVLVDSKTFTCTTLPYAADWTPALTKMLAGHSRLLLGTENN